MVEKKTPATPIKNGPESATPDAGAKPPAAPAETLTAQAPLKDGASEKKSTKDSIKEEASKIGGQAADRARSFAGEGKERATGALDEFAKMMTGAAGDVDEKLGPQYGKYARTAADGISGFADSLRAKEIDDLIADASAFVKKSPAIAIGTAAAVGFVLARLIKSGVDAISEDGDAPASDQA
jgi:ElaB/YqjD/DUF883 family membrane-anchored ribosome-binding protein